MLRIITRRMSQKFIHRSHASIKIRNGKKIRFSSSPSWIDDNNNNNNNTKRKFSTVTITYVEPDGNETEVEAEVGKNILDIAQDNNIELEGACGGELACATCHVVFEDEDIYDSLPEKDEEEEDMLDLAFELTDTSRLGCQIKVREDFSGTRIRIPDDGF